MEKFELVNTENPDKLPVAFKAAWVKALRSGEYEQGRHRLYNANDNNFCCLGVAGSLCGMSLQELAYAGGEFTSSNIDIIPYLLIRKNGVGIERNGVIVTAVIEKNDNAGESFIQIADFIDKNL